MTARIVLVPSTGTGSGVGRFAAIVNIVPVLLLLLGGVSADDFASRATAAAAADAERSTGTGSSSSGSSGVSGSVYVIGDLHGDAYCAHHWVKQTGLIANLGDLPYRATDVIWDDTDSPNNHNNGDDDDVNVNVNTNNATASILQASQHWEWTDASSDLVFLGDYIDKGPTSLPTLTLVKALCERFPHHVTALLGNHELELLLDRDTTGNRGSDWGSDGALYFQMGYSAAHPRDYLDYLPPQDRTDPVTVELDTWVMTQLYRASLEIYAQNLEHSARMAPLSNPQSVIRYLNKDGHEHPLTLEEQQVVSDRLQVYQTHYLASFAPTTSLGQWLQTLPVVHVSPTVNTIFVHGGLRNHPLVLKQFQQGDSQTDVTTRINQMLANHTHPDKMHSFMQTTEGAVIYDMVTFRGNHKQQDGCGSLEASLKDINMSMSMSTTNVNNIKIKRLAVGHTPYDDIQIKCDGQLLALDSALGRWMRAVGNDYCMGDKSYSSSSIDSSTSDSNSKYTCEPIITTCEGQIVRLYKNDPKGKMDVIDSNGKTLQQHALFTPEPLKPLPLVSSPLTGTATSTGTGTTSSSTTQSSSNTNTDEL
jgi:hypothetical protein